jgi:hypothetical protein
MNVFSMFEFFLLIVSLLTWCISCADQPWPIKAESVGKCCSLIKFEEAGNFENESKILSKCFQQEAESDKPIAIITLAERGSGEYRINDIELFSAFQFPILQSFCDHRGYLCRLLDRTLPDLETVEDFRWHKIKLIQSALASWGKGLKAIVWIGNGLKFGVCNI